VKERLTIAIACYPTFGGSGVIATEVGLELAALGHRVHFISYAMPSRLATAMPRDNVFFHEVQPREYPLFYDSSYPLALASKMVEIARRDPLDVVHVHYALPHATSAYLAKQILGDRAPKIIVTLHGTDITLVGSDPSFLPITRFSILAGDAITVPSRHLKQATYDKLDIPNDVPIEVIPNFVDTERFCPIERAPSTTKRMVHVSNFRPLKRVDDVIRVFARVRASIDAELILIGDGPERARIEVMVERQGLQSRVSFLGERTDFIEHLRSADLFLLPSETESFGLAALEAQSCGVPVIASNAGGLPEVIAHGRTGFLERVGDVDAMASRALELLADPARQKEQAKAARERVLELFSRGPRRYLELYQRTISSTSSRRAPS
jgi:N-acetyl-alpha-D-glucosaminyl L-malate synthase BshA